MAKIDVIGRARDLPRGPSLALFRGGGLTSEVRFTRIATFRSNTEETH